VERLERRLIREALERSGGNRSEAARLLGISRNGLALKMDRLGLEG
jgi:DNA-binding NtrC family response regulator